MVVPVTIVDRRSFGFGFAIRGSASGSNAVLATAGGGQERQDEDHCRREDVMTMAHESVLLMIR